MLKKLKLFSILFALAFLLTSIGCSSSSSGLRYGDNEQLNRESTTIHTVENTSIEDSSFAFEEDEIPEYQDPSDLPENESEIDLTDLMNKISSNSGNSDGKSEVSSRQELMIMEIIKYMNTPYKFGGNSLNGIDCSAFTQNVYQDSWLIKLNRSARDQYQQGTVIDDRAELKFGDLVFFNTRRRVRPGHVGIYIGDNLFAHASSKSGVTISSLEQDYYNKRYMGARRLEE